MLYSTGDEVEVRSDEDGFRGARFAARIVRSMPKLGRFAVEYETLMSDSDPTRKHQETVDGDHLRPRPPPPPPAAGPCRFGVGQRVDALQNEAWWDAVVREVLEDGGRYRLMFLESKEEAEFAAEELRVHMEWVNREWNIPEPKMSSSSRRGRGSRYISTTSFRPPTTPHADNILLSEDGLSLRPRPTPSSARDTHTLSSAQDTSTTSLAQDTPTPSSCPPFVPTMTRWISEYPNLHYDAGGRYLPRHGDPPTPPERPIGEFRHELWPLNKELFYPSTATPVLGALIRGNYHGPYINFSQVPDEKKFIWLEQMKKSYWWPEHRDNAIRKTYKGACSHKIRDAMDDLKKAIARGKGKKKWVLEEYWGEMQARLETPEFKKRSEQAKKARSCVGLHTGGSIPAVVHARNLANKIANEGKNSSGVRFVEVFEHTHKRKDGTYVDEKASKTYAAFQSLRTEATSRATHDEVDESVGQSTNASVPTSSHTSVQDNDLWIKVVGGKGKGGHIYGTGSLATQLSVVSRPPPAYSSALPPSDDVLAQVVSTVSKLQSNMERMQETIESMRSERIAPAISVADDAPVVHVVDTVPPTPAISVANDAPVVPAPPVPAISLADDAHVVTVVGTVPAVPASYLRHDVSFVPTNPVASSITADMFVRFVSALPPGVVSSLPQDIVSSLPPDIVSLLPRDVVTHLQVPPLPPPPPPPPSPEE